MPDLALRSGADVVLAHIEIWRPGRGPAGLPGGQRPSVGLSLQPDARSWPGGLSRTCERPPGVDEARVDSCREREFCVRLEKYDNGRMPAKEKVLVALTVFCFSEAIKLITHDLLPIAVKLLAGILSP